MKITDTILGYLGSSMLVIVGVTWTLQGRLTSIEMKLEPVPAIQKDVADLKIATARQDEINKATSEKIDKLEKPMLNTQANAKLLLKEVGKLKADPEVAGSKQLGPYGAIN